MMNQLQLLATSWSTAAAGYNTILVPRFAPWTNHVLKLLSQELLPSLQAQLVDEKTKNKEDQLSDHCHPSPLPFLYSCCVPCCGPGQELLPLAEILGSDWYILGVDLAPGMIQVAKDRIHNHNIYNNIDALVGDCSTRLPIPPPLLLPSSNSNHHHCDKDQDKDKSHYYYDLIVSMFGFQQMSDPEAVLQVWLDSLEPNHGLLVILFWPSAIENNLNDSDNNDVNMQLPLPKPFTKWSQVVSERLNQQAQSLNSNSQPPSITATTTSTTTTTSSSNNNNNNNNNNNHKSWDDELMDKVKQQLLYKDCVLVKDEYISYNMEWSTREEFWNGLTHAGPWHAMRLKRGDDFVDSLQQEVCSVFDSKNSKDHDGPLVHRANARLWVLQRRKQKDDNDDSTNNNNNNNAQSNL